LVCGSGRLVPLYAAGFNQQAYILIVYSVMASNRSHMLREVGSARAAVVPKVIYQLVVDSTVPEGAKVVVVGDIIILLDEIVCLVS
jgi:hypothetical protein